MTADKGTDGKKMLSFSNPVSLRKFNRARINHCVTLDCYCMPSA
uniref:Uncharacterized protein n=1 Tax=Anguilla anguilla TaxID=7936 RepID=A0A0E9SLF0_ANGAN